MPPPPRRPPKDLGALTPTALRDFVRFNGGKTVIQHFRVLDQDGSGDLTRKEFLQGVRTMGFVSATEAEANFVWQWLDKDCDGCIPYKELDKRIRDRPVETDTEKEAREAEERAAAEKAAAEEKAAQEAAQAAAEAAAKAEAAAQKEAKAAAKAAAKAEKAATKPKKSSRTTPPSTPKSAKPKKASSPQKAPKPQPPPFSGFRGVEGWVKPTLAANGFPVQAPPPPAATSARGEPTARGGGVPPAIKPVDGTERFLKPTIGTASLSDVTGAGFVAAAAASTYRDSASHHEGVGEDCSQTNSTSAARKPAPRSEFGSPGWKPTTHDPAAAALSVRAAPSGGRVSQVELAARDLEARKAAEAERRERARRLALRAAEEAEHSPMPTKHPEPANWMRVPAHERKGSLSTLAKGEQDADLASGVVASAAPVDFRAPDDQVFAFFMETIAGGDRLISSWAGEEERERLW
jgi:hypothetical protein